MYLHQLHEQGNNQFKFPLSFIFDLIENYVFIIQFLWTHVICNNNNIHVNILTDHTCFTAKYKNIQPWKKAITYKFTAYFLWVMYFTTYTIFKRFTQYEIPNQCMLYSTCDVISFFKCSFIFCTHKLSKPIKVWHLKHLVINGNSFKATPI